MVEEIDELKEQIKLQQETIREYEDLVEFLRKEIEVNIETLESIKKSLTWLK